MESKKYAFLYRIYQREKEPSGMPDYESGSVYRILQHYEHRADSAEDLVHAVLTNEKMWGEDLSKIEGLEAKVTENLMKIREEGAEAAYASCL